MTNKKRNRKRKNKNKQCNITFRWEYAHESITERDSGFRRNYPEYE